jgi:2-oxoglutarate ferredoxin oxidoreductase subunit beta
MELKDFNLGKLDIAWCPGCGNFGILNTIKNVLAQLDIKPQQLVMVSGIGQAAKTPHYFKTNLFNGLHGRALPVATAIKAVNPSLIVIAESGDGDMYGEGGNHFIHTIRRNPNIVNIIHNNMVYGLTKGQASPTSQKGFKTPIQIEGVQLKPFNPLALAISLDASFVARTLSVNREESVSIIKEAIMHKGYALVDIFQPCVTYNKLNTYDWFKNNTYYVDKDYTPNDRKKALDKAFETDKLPMGIIYKSDKKSTFEQTLRVYDSNSTPLVKRKIDLRLIESEFASIDRSL